MLAFVDRKRKVVGVLVHDVVNAGHLGYGFARHNPDLVKTGWVLYYYDSEEQLRVCAESAPVVTIDHYISGIVDAINDVCPVCGHTRP